MIIRAFSFALAASMFMQLFVAASTSAILPEHQVIRVSCPLQEGFFEVDQNGNYSGYSYDYLMKVAQHVGWKYDFIVYVPTNENLTNALEQLKTGEVDLIAGMVYSDSLAETYQFSSVPYGQSDYVLMADLDNTLLNQRTYTEFPRLHVALNETATVSNSLFEEFAKKQGLDYEAVYTTGSECKQMVQDGKADLMISENIVKNEGFKTIASFASEPFYFASSKENAALINKLSRVMTEIQDVDPYYTAKLRDQHFNFESNFTLALTTEEHDYLKTNPVIRMIILTNHEPVQHYDPHTGEFSGIVIDIIRKISEQSGLTVEFVPADNLAQVKQMLNNHEADAFAGFPNSYSAAETYNLLLTSPIFSMPVVRLSNINGKTKNAEILVSSSIKLFENQKNILYVEELAHIFDLVDRGEYKEAYVNGYMAQRYIKQGKFANTLLTPTPYSNYDLCIGVSRRSDIRLMCILEQMISKIKLINVEDIVYQNTTIAYEVTLLDMIRRNPVGVLGPTLLIFVLLTTLLCIMVLKTRKLNKVISKEKNKYQEISAKDALSRAYNNDTFKQFCKGYLSSRDDVTGTLLICDIDNFKSINDTCGHNAGDYVIERLGGILLELFSGEHVVGRLGGDEFAVLIKGVAEPDLVKRNCKALLACTIGISEQCKVTLSIGAAVFTRSILFDVLYDSADKALYTVKNAGKNDYKILFMP